MELLDTYREVRAGLWRSGDAPALIASIDKNPEHATIADLREGVALCESAAFWVAQGVTLTNTQPEPEAAAPQVIEGEFSVVEPPALAAPADAEPPAAKPKRNRKKVS